MAELIVAVLGAAAALVLWRALKARGLPSYETVAASGFGVLAPQAAPEVHHWPRLGRFDFEVAETDNAHHQATLRHALARHGPMCVATLMPGSGGHDPGAPVEVQVGGLRVGFLSDGDATRFHHRLAFESRGGQISQCGARIVCTDEGRRSERKTCTILLDLKPFRH